MFSELTIVVISVDYKCFQRINLQIATFKVIDSGA